MVDGKGEVKVTIQVNPSAERRKERGGKEMRQPGTFRGFFEGIGPKVSNLKESSIGAKDSVNDYKRGKGRWEDGGTLLLNNCGRGGNQ